MRQFFLRLLAFFLGFKHKTPEEDQKEGRKLIEALLLRKLRSRIDLQELETIWLIGAIAYSESTLNEIKDLHKAGHTYDFKIPTNFSFDGDYIDFYQTSTSAKRYYLMAISDSFSFHKNDDVMMFIEISAPYPTSHLKKTLQYFGAQKP